MKLIKPLLRAIVASMLLVSSVSAQTTTVELDDNFDSGALDAAWVKTLTGEFAGTSGGITDITATGPESAFTANAGGFSAYFTDQSGQTAGDLTGQESQLRFTMPSGSVGAVGESLSVQFDFLAPAGPLRPTLANVQIQNFVPGVDGAPDVGSKGSNTTFFNRGGTNNFINHNGTTNEVLLTDMEQEVWYRLNADYTPNGAAADGLALTLTKFGEATPVLDLTTTVQTDQESVNSIFLHWNIPNQNLGRDFYIDNVLVTSVTSDTMTILGDFDGNGLVELADLDEYNGNLGQTVAANPGLADLDLDGNGTIEAADLEQHYTDLVGTSNGGTGTVAGDANLDGIVDVLGDAAALINNLGPGATSWAQGDFNADGVVDVLGDAAALINNLGADNGGAPAPATAAVPEPGSLSLLALAGLGAIVRRRR